MIAKDGGCRMGGGHHASGYVLLGIRRSVAGVGALDCGRGLGDISHR